MFLRLILSLYIYLKNFMFFFFFSLYYEIYISFIYVLYLDFLRLDLSLNVDSVSYFFMRCDIG